MHQFHRTATDQLQVTFYGFISPTPWYINKAEYVRDEILLR